MKWTPQADEAVKKTPFFVRKRVRLRVEEEARRTGRNVVTAAEVEATRRRFLSGMASEVKGHRVEVCFGSSGCPNKIGLDDNLAERIEAVLKKADLLSFLKNQGINDLKFHHEFRVTLADCPNACSQPQIKDIGIIAACTPKQTAADCTGCEACTTACREKAVSMDINTSQPAINMRRCLACGQCAAVCPTGRIEHGARGYRVLVGGKLGRRPQLAEELPGIYSSDTVPDIVRACLDLYKAKSKGGERFGEILRPECFKQLADHFQGRRADSPPL